MDTRQFQAVSKLKKKYSPGELLLMQGEDSSDVYILAEGIVEILVDGKAVAELDAKEGNIFFGEIAYILGEPRSASVRAKTEVEALCITGDSLLKVLGLSPSLLQRLLQQNAHRIIDLNHQINIDDQNPNTPASIEDLHDYIDGLLCLVGTLKNKKRDPEINKLHEYLLETNPMKKKNGNLINLDMDMLHFCGLGKLFS